MNKRIIKTVSFVVALLLIITTIPIFSTAKAIAAESDGPIDLPEEMKHNVFLDALNYLGYDTDAVVKSGYDVSKLGYNEKVNQTGIKYWNGSYNVSAYVYKRGNTLINKTTQGTAFGDEETKDGKPDVEVFRKLSTQCGGYVTYVYTNYLHNIAGIDMSWYRSTANNSERIVPHPLNPLYWKNTMDKVWVRDKKIKKIYDSEVLNQAGDNYRTLDKIVSEDKLVIPIGAILIMKEKDANLLSSGHIVIYMGCYKGVHYVAHITSPLGGGIGPSIVPISDIENRRTIEKDPEKSNKRVIAIYAMTGSAKLKVSSSAPTITNGNSNYSLEGAEYTVFTNKNKIKETTVGTFKIDKNGNSNTLELMPGTYYFKSTKATDSYFINDTIKSFNVSISSSVNLTSYLKPRFKDVLGSNIKGNPNYQYYYNPVYWAYENGITKGYSDYTFRPQNQCERRELMIFLWRIAGCPTGYGDANDYFADLEVCPVTSDTNKAIAWGYSTGLINGYANENEGEKPLFKPTASITRLETTIILYRLAGAPEIEGDNIFSDTQSFIEGTDTYNSIIWSATNRIACGYPDGTFRPDDNCLREYTITFLYRAKDLLMK